MMWLLLALAAQAQDIKGFAEVRASVFVDVDGTPIQVVERFRPTFDAPLGERLHLSTTVEFDLAQGRDTSAVFQQILEESALAPFLDAADCVWHEPTNEVFRIDRVSDTLSVDRLYLDWYHPKFDLRIGRQALQWGSGLFINPTDPFPQVLFTEPYKPRAGVNSVRITVPFGELNQFQAVIGTNDTFTKVRAAARGTVNAVNTDFSLVSAYRQESDEILAGVDIKGTAGVGFWFEGGIVFTCLTTDAESDLYETLAVGLDYSFPIFQTFIISAQYIRNGAGGDAVAGASFGGIDGPDCAVATPFDSADEPNPFAPFLSSKNYGLLALSSGLTQDLSASVSWLQNMDDGSAILIPNAGLRFANGLDVSFVAQIPLSTWGDGGEFHPAADDLMLEIPTGADPLTVDLSGLVPAATLSLWTRYNF